MPKIIRLKLLQVLAAVYLPLKGFFLLSLDTKYIKNYDDILEKHIYWVSKQISDFKSKTQIPKFTRASVYEIQFIDMLN